MNTNLNTDVYNADVYLRLSKEDGDKEESDSILVITVSTLHFGIVKATLILESSNSVQVLIECSEEFPKNELNLRINNEQKFYAMDSVISYSLNKTKSSDSPVQNANINTSQTTQINPYLLLMAHTVIKHIIDIDNNKKLGITSHTDEF